MKGKGFPEDKIEEEKRYPHLIKGIRKVKVFFSSEDKERIKEKVFSSLYPKRSLFYKKVLLSTAFIFLLLLPAFSFLLITKERVKNRHFFFERKNLTQEERVLERPFTLSPYPYFEGETKLAKGEKKEEEKEALSEEGESSTETASKIEESSSQVEEGIESQEGGGESSEEKESDGGEEESPSPAPPPTPSNFTVLSGNLKDILSWEKIEGATYRVYKATSLTGPFTLTTETEVNMYVEEISESEVG